jgi:hypothetical protein
VSYYTVFTPLAWTYRESSVGLAIAENLNGTSGLKPESSISYSGIDALKRLRRRSFLLSQLAWSRYKHEHRLCSLSLLSHHHNLHDNALSVITTVPVCFCGASMRYYLANRRNASRRRGWLLPSCAVDLRVRERPRWAAPLRPWHSKAGWEGGRPCGNAKRHLE